MVVAVLTLATVAIGILLAGIVVWASPRRGTNWTLAGVVLGNAIETLPGVFGTLLSDRKFDYNAWLWLIAGVFNTAFMYVLFLSFALDTPMTRPLRRPLARGLLIGLMVFTPVIPFLFPQQTLSGMGTFDADTGWVWNPGPIYVGALLLFVAMAPLGITAGVWALRHAERGTTQRRRAKAYLAAFLTQDVGYAVVLIFDLIRPDQTVLFNLGNTLVTLAFCGMVAAALLRTQLFDFDLKLKIGFTRGAIAAVFLGVFFAVFGLTQHWFQDLGALWGGLAVGMLLFALVPIQRAAESLADRVFPGVSDETGYLMRKKVEVYREALLEATGPGHALDPSKAARLRKLRSTLGLTSRDHEMVMGALSGTMGSRSMQLVPGAEILGKYRIERELGAGGGGRVFLARDLRMNRNVVLKKVIGPGGTGAVREARAAASIEHPNVVRVYDVEEIEGDAIIVMEHVDGGSLKDRLRAGGALSRQAFARIADGVLAGLEAVHAAGAVHRDIKPGNVLVTRDGVAKISDFGVARMPGYDTTLGGMPTGSIQYMSPEQARGKRVTAQSDLYSAAVTLYEAHTGRCVVVPQAGESAMEMQIRVGSAQPVDTSMADSALRPWFKRATAPVPENRFKDADDMRRALARILRPKAAVELGLAPP